MTDKKDLVLTFEADLVENITTGKKNEVKVTIKPDKMLDFLIRIMDDDMVDAFLSDEMTKKWLIERIGVDALLLVYKKEDVLKSVGWDYVREFFLDKIDTVDILNHIGFEKVREHFADKLSVEKVRQNDINNNGNKSVLEELNASEGEN